MTLKRMVSRVRAFRDFVESRPYLGIVFQEPATEKQIRQFESGYDWVFLDPVRALLLVFNGEDPKQSLGACGRYNFCSLEMMLNVFGMGQDCANQFHRPPVHAHFLTQENSWRDDWTVGETTGCQLPNAILVVMQSISTTCPASAARSAKFSLAATITPSVV